MSIGFVSGWQHFNQTWQLLYRQYPFWSADPDQEDLHGHKGEEARRPQQAGCLLDRSESQHSGLCLWGGCRAVFDRQQHQHQLCPAILWLSRHRLCPSSIVSRSTTSLLSRYWKDENVLLVGWGEVIKVIKITYSFSPDKAHTVSCTAEVSSYSRVLSVHRSSLSSSTFGSMAWDQLMTKIIYWFPIPPMYVLLSLIEVLDSRRGQGSWRWTSSDLHHQFWQPQDFGGQHLRWRGYSNDLAIENL